MLPLIKEDGVPRFFFDTHDGHDSRDDTGVDCADLLSARREALQATGEMLREKTDFWVGEPWTMTVRDDADAIVATVVVSVR